VLRHSGLGVDGGDPATIQLMTEPPAAEPVLRCQTENGLGHALLGYHDGIDRWTINVAQDSTGRLQSFVSRHEAAHYQLHAATPWGLAVLVAGVPAADGTIGRDRWAALLDGCRRTHEVYATWASAEQTDDADDLLIGNPVYAAYLRDGRRLAWLIAGPDDPPPTDRPLGDRAPAAASRGVDLLLRLVMAPAALVGTDLATIRSGDVEPGGDELPDSRLAHLLAELGGSDLLSAVRTAVDVEPTAQLHLDDVFAQLAALGLPSMTFAQQATWTEAIVAELEREHPGRFVIESRADGRDLSTSLDDQQRERVQMHDEPLRLEVLVADDQGRFDTTRFGRSDPVIGKHVWLTWLDPAFLRRQFVTDHPFAPGPVLGLLSCDRTHGDPIASWFAFPEVPPGPAATALGSRDTTPLLFTTLRTLDATGDDVSFRGFEPAFVLIDSNTLAFLERSLQEGALDWTVIGSTGSRTIEILIYQQREIPGVFYLYVCSAPTGHLTAAWLRSHDPPCLPDSAAFEPVRPLAWALIEHLLGTFWMFDLYGDTT
jgi:hypothetical protein